MTDDYKVTLDVYSGPLDLLLFLIRRQEIDIYDIPIARITKQYIEYVDVLRQLDPESVSEFLVLAATLMEIKSRMLLPVPPPEEDDQESIDPRQDLVRQLLEYKEFKDRARLLEQAADDRALRHERAPAQIEQAPDALELENVDVWVLLEAFRKLLEQVGKAGPVHKVEVDDTPIALHIEDILDAIRNAEGLAQFESLFAGRNRAEMIGLFLALLELIRQKAVRVQQEKSFGPILIGLREPEPDRPDDQLWTADSHGEGHVTTHASMPVETLLGPSAPLASPEPLEDDGASAVEDLTAVPMDQEGTDEAI